MRITIIGLNFAPEVTGIAPYTTAIAEGLAARGHEVEVLAGLPHYPGWREVPGYRGRPVERLGRATVRRIEHYVPRGHAMRTRLRMELSFARLVAARRWDSPDVVLTVSPSLLAAGAVVAAARVRGVPSVVVVQDLYGKGADETGALSAAAGALTRLEGRILSAASRVVVIHDRFASTVGALGIPAHRISTIRNWTHVPDVGRVDVASIRARLGWSAEEIVVLHTGNMGLKQGLENVVEAARIADARGLRVRFSLVGGGNQHDRLVAAATGVAAIEFRDPLPPNDFLCALRAADVLLVNERPGIAEMAVPSKLTSYFASGRPVVAATDAASTTAAEMHEAGAGTVVPPGQPQTLLDACLALASDVDRAAACGAAAREFAAQRLGAARAIAEYEDVCRSVIGARRSVHA